jgi:hypothetical protein
MPVFTLEALEAKHGDSLILHYGDEKAPRFIVIDGGPAGVWAGNLKPRLAELKAEWSPDEPLPLEMVMVSHIDDDHINGILGLTDELVRQGDDPQWDVLALWHNSFDEILGNSDQDLFSRLTSKVRAASLGTASPAAGPLRDQHKAAVVASVGQGRKLRANAEKLGLVVNEPFEGLVLAAGDKKTKVDWGEGLSFTVLGPDRPRVEDLHAKWEKELEKTGPKEAAAAAYVDESVFNLSSIVVLAEFGRKRMLLTGDALGSDVLQALAAAKLLKGGRIHVEILKLPHHGSDRNVATDFFRTVTADHYVVSGDGEHGNPEVATLAMISEARPDDDFAIHLTNRTGKKGIGEKLAKFFAGEKKRRRKYEVVFREDDERSVTVDLLKPIKW